MPDLIDVAKVSVLSDYHLLIEFEDGKAGVFDVSPYLERGVFRNLMDEQEFATAHISGGTVAWRCGADIAPERLYEGIAAV